MTDDQEEWEAAANAPMPSDTIAQRVDSLSNLLLTLGGFPADSKLFALGERIVEATITSIEAKRAELHELNEAKAKRSRA